MKNSICLKIMIMISLVVLLFEGPGHAAKARLTDIIVTNTRDDLLAYLTVEGAFREEMNTAISSGVPTTFSYFFSLYQVRNLWVDKKIADIKITHTLKYNALKKEFIVKRSWESGEPKVLKSYDKTKRLMCEVDRLKIISLAKLKKGNHYQLRAKAELSKRTLPFYLHYVLFFVSLWDFETDWYTIDFIY